MFRFLSFQKIGTSTLQSRAVAELRAAPICLLYLARPLLAAMPGMIYWRISWIIAIGRVILLKLCRGCVKRASPVGHLANER